MSAWFSFPPSRHRSSGLACLLLAGLWTAGCRDQPPDEGLSADPPPAQTEASAPARAPGGGEVPAADPAQVVGDFFAGATALQVGDTDTARQRLEATVSGAPGEAAAWSNLAIARLRGQSPDREGAASAIEEARRLAPKDDGVAVVEAAVLAQLGRIEEAHDALRRAVEAAPDNLRARFALYEALDASGEVEAAAAELAHIREAVPDNLAAAMAALRRAAATDDVEAMGVLLAVAEGRGEAIPENARAQLTVAREALEAEAVDSAAGAAVGLANMLLGSDAFRADQADLSTDFQNVAEPLMWPLTLEVPPALASPADRGIGWRMAAALRADADAVSGAGEPTRIVALATGTDASVSPFALDGDRVRDAIAVDLDNDGRAERVEVGAAGLRAVAFDEEDGETILEAPSSDLAYDRVWAVDLDLEGDLDLLLAPADGGSVSALRNDGDGGWTAFDPAPLADLAAPLALVWFDADGDGDGDLAAIDAQGRLRRFANERAGVFEEQDPIEAEDAFLGLAVADLALEGRLTLLALRADGALLALPAEGEARELVTWTGEPSTVDAPATLRWADLDNNGAGDLLIGWGDDTQIWLAEPDGTLVTHEIDLGGRVDDVAELSGDGRLDLVGVALGDDEGAGASVGGGVVWLSEGGDFDYGWQLLRFVAKTTGDVRNNSFGVGSEVALRTGVLVQARAVERPWVHFGLGDVGADVYRVRWPNGAIQGEFELATEAMVAIEQRLVASCPWLFAWNGERMDFVTDVIWRSPLGLRINAQTTAGVLMTRDRVKVGGEQLRPRDGAYDLRITAELWETHFFDEIALTVVDHPEDVEVWIDERFVVPPQALEVQATGPLRPLVAATGASGADMIERLAERDGRYVDDFELGRYQGVAGDHALELLLDEVSPTATAGEVLVAQGWIYPTDSSINVAISQGEHVPPVPLSIEVPDPEAEGGWRVAREGLGFPAGKRKTMLLALDGLWPEGAERRLRLRTTLEIYWDRIAVAERRPEAEIQFAMLRPELAELRPRGFSATTHWPVRRRDAAGSRRAPELPDYENLATSQPMWLDLAGFYTRFGDVGELLERVDDRYVILNAGDELAIRFPAVVPDPGPGWARDFVFESDGWVKDGNFNTAYSATVHPLPAHDRPEYADQIVHGPAGELAADPVFQANAADWERWHTREVRPVPFADVLRVAPPE